MAKPFVERKKKKPGTSQQQMAEQLELLKLRAARCKKYIGAYVLDLGLDIMEKLDILTRTIKKQQQQLHEAEKKALEASIFAALDKRQHAEAHRLSKCVAGTKYGKRNRNYSRATRS
eukprot:6388218-Pyramimonas_sp.AAC.1